MYSSFPTINYIYLPAELAGRWIARRLEIETRPSRLEIGIVRNRAIFSVTPGGEKRAGADLRRLRTGVCFSALLLSGLVAAAGQTLPKPVVSAGPPDQPAAGLPVLTTAREAHNLSNAEAGRNYPVHLRGVITYLDPDWGNLGKAAIFLHDSTGSVYISETSARAKNIFVGALVEVQGVSNPGGYGPIVASQDMRVLGRAPLPAYAPRVTLAHLRTGAEDAQWIEVEGSVHSVIEYSHSVTLRLEMADGPIGVVMLKEPGATYSNLVDAEVRIRANAAPTVNADGQLIGVRLQAPNLSTLKVIEPAPRDAFALPPVPIDKLLSWGHYFTAMHRIHLRGKATLQWPGSLLCIRDAAGAICAQTTQDTPVAEGDTVDVAGFVGTENNDVVITDAIFRSAGGGPSIAPQPVTAESVLRGGFGSELIRIDGQLIGYDLTSSSGVTLLLSSGNTFFPVILPHGLATGGASPWRIGSRLRFTGICAVSVDTESHVREGTIVIESFRVLLRSPADVTVLELPTWWTPLRAILLLSLALTCALGFLVWAILLRRRIEKQAGLLRESEQKFRHMALHDALTGLATRVLMQDRLSVALESARRHRTGVAILMVDLDRFKEVNDTYGHPAGDEVLRISAARLRGAVRRGDTVARIGGDEFVVLLSDVAEPEAAEVVAAKIVKALSVPVSAQGQAVPVSVSVGVCAAGADEFDAEALMRNADAALYAAKNGGRNQYQVFTADAVVADARREF